MDKAKIEAGVRMILDAIGEFGNGSDLEKTPERVAEMVGDILSGYTTDTRLSATFTEAEIGSDLIQVNNIGFYSICEHHLLPFFGKVDIAYVPQNGKIAGFSGFNRLIDAYARRLQIQERMTRQIATAIQEALDPKGVLVRVSATQLCAAMRGKHPKPIRSVTHCRIGDLPDFPFHRKHSSAS